jgi:integrase
MAVTLTLVRPRKYKRKAKPAPVAPSLPPEAQLLKDGIPSQEGRVESQSLGVGAIGPQPALQRASALLPTEVTPGGELKLLEELPKPFNPGLTLVPAPPIECPSLAPEGPGSPLPALARGEEPAAPAEALEAPVSPVLVPEAVEKLIEHALSTCVSDMTRRIYRTQMYGFFRSGYRLDREGVANYLQDRRERDASNPTLQSIAAALRKLAKEALIRKLLSREEYDGIVDLKPGKSHRTRMGLWLTISQVERLLSLPDRSTLMGRRDVCILGVMLGCGLRRSEVAELAWECYQSREGRMCFVDLKGKGDKRRTVPVPTWLVSDLEAWKRDCETSEELWKGGWYLREADRRLIAGGLKPDTIHKLTNEYGVKMGIPLLNPHDLRRTLARMLRKAGANLEQIQHTLGHESIETTTIYLGSVIELAPGLAAVDRIKLEKYGEQFSGFISAEAVNQLEMGLLLEQLAEKIAARNQDNLPEGSD